MDFFQVPIVEFFGLPQAGKTTSVNYLLRNFDSSLQVRQIKERSGVSPIKDKLHPIFNYWTSVAFLKEYIEANELSIDMLLADRGLIDAFVWINMLSKHINDPSYLDSFLKLVDSANVFKNYKIAFYCFASIETLIKRNISEQPNKLHSKIVNYDVLTKYIASYNEVKPQIDKWCYVVELNSDKNSREVIQSYLKETLLK